MATGGPERGEICSCSPDWMTEEIGEAIHPAKPAGGCGVVKQPSCHFTLYTGSFEAKKKKKKSEVNGFVIQSDGTMLLKAALLWAARFRKRD